MENYSNQQNDYGRDSKSFMTKGLIILILTLLLLIPIPFILNLIEVRQESQIAVVNEIGDKWSGKQVIYGPFIQISYQKLGKDSKGKPLYTTEKVYVSANNNTINADVKHAIKKRSLYEVVIYNSDIKIKTSFPTYTEILSKIEIPQSDITDVKLVFSVEDVQGIENQLMAKSGGKQYQLNFDNENEFSVPNKMKDEVEKPEAKSNSISLNVFSRSVDPVTFDFKNIEMNVKLKGSQNLSFLSSAISSNIILNSDWKDLKFDGVVLPNDSTSENGNSTQVNWKIYNQNPMNGQFWKNNIAFNDYTFGVDFIQMNDHYDKTYRSTKYAILFIGLTFVLFFFMDNRNHYNIHIVQYALVGFALIINFVLLLSISEYLGFEYAYLISALATIGLIVFFVYGFIKDWSVIAKLALMLILLYGFIYSVLQLKEHALLVGSIGLFIILAIIMYYSRNIEWKGKI